MKILPRSVRVLLMLVAAGCAASTGSHPSEYGGTALNILTTRDLEPLSARTLYEAISELRPSFVRRNIRGEPPTVFVNGIEASSFNVLHYMSTADIAEVRWLRGADATARHGNVHTGAVLEVTLRRS